jgi:peroxiredoxin
MEALEVIVRLFLAAMFVVAGAAKLADRDGSREALSAFGVPDRLAAPGAVALPIVELSAAALLIPSATVTAGAAVSLALLLAFCAGMARSIARGEAPDCHCFGSLHSEPVSRATLLRNLLLAAGSGFVLLASLGGESASAFGWIADLSGAALAASVAGLGLLAGIALAGLFAFSLLRRQGVLLLRIDALETALRRHGIPVDDVQPSGEPASGLPVGAEAPEFNLPGVHGETITLAALLAADKPAMLVFTDPGCGPCTALLPQVAAWQRDHEGRLTIALISRGSIDDNRAKAAEHGASRMFVEEGMDVSSLYEAQATPSAVVVSADGRIASHLVGGEPAIRALVDSTLSTSGLLQVVPGGPGPAPAGVAPGEKPPEVALTDLEGAPVALADFSGEDTLLLFWDPACGFCSQMLARLQAFERSAAGRSPRLLVISKGSAETNRAMGLSSTVVLDSSFAAGKAFAAPGTPSAVLLDSAGRAASGVAAGADAVLELAGRAVEA